MDIHGRSHGALVIKVILYRFAKSEIMAELIANVIKECATGALPTRSVQTRELNYPAIGALFAAEIDIKMKGAINTVWPSLMMKKVLEGHELRYVALVYNDRNMLDDQIVGGIPEMTVFAERVNDAYVAMVLRIVLDQAIDKSKVLSSLN
jgi:hypothetical protein